MLRDRNRTEDPTVGKRPSMFGRTWRGVKRLGAPATRAFPKDEVVEGGRAIGRLIAAVRQGRPGDPRFRLHEDRRFDLEATAFLHGLSAHQLEAVLWRRQRQTAVAAYIAFGFGWVFFLLWLFKAATTPWSSWRILPVLEFAPFCVFLFLIAFRSALQNYQIRTRRLATAGEYLDTSGQFWPS
ncbi:MAG: hypothetical protein WBO09_06055 [Methylocystis silviterrae]|uniref:hypothetical protein n=1 Tax=Methylocystis silviterrae TaxID=2743612 RepID=UPI003C715273